MIIKCFDLKFLVFMFVLLIDYPFHFLFEIALINLNHPSFIRSANQILFKLFIVNYINIILWKEKTCYPINRGES